MVEEIKQIALCLDPNSVMVIDGFSSGFFKSYWKIIRDILEIIRRLMRFGSTIKKVDKTLIAFIPKHEAAEQIHNSNLIDSQQGLYGLTSRTGDEQEPRTGFL